jgi:hypothetical protein
MKIIALDAGEVWEANGEEKRGWRRWNPLATFPFFLGFDVSPVSSLGLVKVNKSVGCREESSQRRGDVERGQMASREGEERVA